MDRGGRYGRWYDTPVQTCQRSRIAERVKVWVWHRFHPADAKEGRKRLLPGQYPQGGWNEPALPRLEKKKP